jgi:hypothetical protein
MKIVLIVPQVVQKYLSQFPDNRNDGYKYFNYDRRVVEERVERGDQKPQYQNPNDFCDADYDGLVAYASTLINPILHKYSAEVACEDALHMAIKSYNNGLFDGKVNAVRFPVLIKAMTVQHVMAAKKKQEPKVIKHQVLKQLGVDPSKIPSHSRAVPKGVPHLVKDKGEIILK